MLGMVDVLMVEHLSIRLLSRCGLYIGDVEEFASFHDFILSCHAKIEDEIVFPILSKYYSGRDEDFVKLVRWIGNDHKLLDTLAKNVVRYGRTGEE